MSKYRKSSQTRRSGYGKEKRISLGWLWLLSGVFVGALGAVFIYERFTHLKPNSDARIAKLASVSTNKTHSHHAAKAQTHAQSPKTNTKAQNASEETVQEFEFYTLLPGMEVQVPEKSAKTQSKVPPQNSAAKSPVTQPTAATATSPPISSSNLKQAALKKTPSIVAKAASTTLSATDDTKRYIIEAGMFRDFGQADSLKAKLALQGFNPHIQKVMTERGETWFRVALGPYYSESLANTQKQSLQALKVRGIVIVHKANNLR